MALAQDVTAKTMSGKRCATKDDRTGGSPPSSSSACRASGTRGAAMRPTVPPAWRRPARVAPAPSPAAPSTMHATHAAASSKEVWALSRAGVLRLARRPPRTAGADDAAIPACTWSAPHHVSLSAARLCAAAIATPACTAESGVSPAHMGHARPVTGLRPGHLRYALFFRTTLSLTHTHTHTLSPTCGDGAACGDDTNRQNLFCRSPGAEIALVQ